MKTMSDREVKVGKVLKTLKSKGFVTWQGDDSPKAYKVLQKVIKKTFDGGGRGGHCLLLRTGDPLNLIDGFKSCSGRFLAFYD